MKGPAIMKKMWISLLLTALFLGSLPVSTAYAAGTVQVSLPGHAITLNGQTISSEYSRYPFLVYQDITYFPRGPNCQEREDPAGPDHGGPHRSQWEGDRQCQGTLPHPVIS